MRVKKFLSLTIFIITLTLQGFSQQLGFQLPEGVKRIRIPFEVHHNLAVIPVIVNNILPLKFILDTGVRTTILTEKTFSDILNLKYEKHIVISGAGGEKLVDAYITSGVTLEIPGLKGTGHAMLVLENDYIELSNYLGTSVNGVLGYELFSRFVVDINYETKIITITRPDVFKPKRRYKSVPITIEDTKPYVIANIEQQNGMDMNMKFMIDTGASHGLLIEKESHESIYLPHKNIPSNIGRGLGGELKGEIARVESLNIGPYSFQNVIATFPELNSYMDSIKRGTVYRNGTLGGEVISRFNVIFDYPHNKLYLKKNSRYRKGFEYNICGIVVKATGTFLDNYIISEVREGSAAAKAGLKEGDKILSVNSSSVDDIRLENVIGYFNSKNNKTIRVEIKRDSVVMRKKFKLERQI